MFCFQCQETAKNQGCTIKGVCGKPEETANLQDLLIHTLKGIAVYGEKLKEFNTLDKETSLFTAKALFTTITNVNWDDESLSNFIKESLQRRNQLRDRFLAVYKAKNGQDFSGTLPDAAIWFSDNAADFAGKAKSVGVLATKNEDVRSLRELLIIGL